jgi:transposase, IS30 family
MKQTKYRRLRAEDRAIIYSLSKAGKTQIKISEETGFSQSTISKEINRNKGFKGYRHKQAQRLANQRQEEKRKRSPVITEELALEITRRLRLKHSPEQISMLLKVVSYETIYRYIIADKAKGGTLYRELRINGKRRYRRRVGTRRSKIPNRTGIEERPKVVDIRQRYGDWEVDLIEGTKGSGYLLSIYERKSRCGLLTKLETKTKEETTQQIIALLQGYKVKTLTYDNGNEFAGHEEITEALGAKGYFAQPYHSWEKGGVENYNGLVRQYFPKGSSFESLKPEQIREAQDEINQRPRKILEAKSPFQLQKKIAA